MGFHEDIEKLHKAKRLGKLNDGQFEDFRTRIHSHYGVPINSDVTEQSEKLTEIKDVVENVAPSNSVGRNLVDVSNWPPRIRLFLLVESTPLFVLYGILAIIFSLYKGVPLTYSPIVLAFILVIRYFSLSKLFRSYKIVANGKTYYLFSKLIVKEKDLIPKPDSKTNFLEDFLHDIYFGKLVNETNFSTYRDIITNGIVESELPNVWGVLSKDQTSSRPLLIRSFKGLANANDLNSFRNYVLKAKNVLSDAYTSKFMRNMARMEVEMERSLQELRNPVPKDESIKSDANKSVSSNQSSFIDQKSREPNNILKSEPRLQTNYVLEFKNTRLSSKVYWAKCGNCGASMGGEVVFFDNMSHVDGIGPMTCFKCNYRNTLKV